MNLVNEHTAGEVAKAVKNGITPDGPSSVRRSASIGALAAAMCKSQAEMKNPTKDAVNPHFKSRYADLAGVLDAVKPAFTHNGLSIMQFPCELDDKPALTTILAHISGEWIEATIALRPTKPDPQGVGSALTYFRRYMLQSIAGITAEDDDDGNAASRPQTQPARQPEQAPAPSTMQARAKFVQRFAMCKSRDELEAIYADIGNALKDRTLTQDDRLALRQPAEETAARFPAVNAR